jgi:alpha-1,6-mannosyltransferase
VAVRAVVGLLNAAAMLYFRAALRTSFGRTAANWYALLQASQFHVIYYASRTLPNMFAYGLSMVASNVGKC